jgi:predicted nucleic acid-binding protein
LRCSVLVAQDITESPINHLACPAVTRFIVDCGVVLRIAEEGIEPAPGHQLLAPTLLRSQTLSALHEAVHRGELAPDVALARLEEITRLITKLPIRLLGDAVLRRNAWRYADRLGWEDTYTAEYVALTHLQGDALVTLDAELARSLEGVVATASIDALRTA